MKLNYLVLFLGTFVANMNYANVADDYMSAEDGVSTDAKHNGYPMCENCTHKEFKRYQYKKCNNCRIKAPNGNLSGTTKKVEGICDSGDEYRVGLFGGNNPRLKCCDKNGNCKNAMLESSFDLLEPLLVVIHYGTPTPYEDAVYGRTSSRDNNISYANVADDYMSAEDGVSTDAKHNGYPMCENCSYENYDGYQYKKCNNCRIKANNVLSGATKKVEGICYSGYEYRVGLFGGNNPRLKCCKNGNCKDAILESDFPFLTPFEVARHYGSATPFGDDVVYGGTASGADSCLGNAHKSTCLYRFKCCGSNPDSDGWSTKNGVCKPSAGRC